MRIEEALKEHLILNECKFVQTWEDETSSGNYLERTNFDMSALLKEIDIFCKTFNKGE